ncbi:MAG: signal peptide peptidase SppA [Candidatus Eisenbacteria bacterium]
MSKRPWILIFIIAVCLGGVLSLFMLVYMSRLLPEGQPLALGSKIGLVEVTGTIVNSGPVVDEILRFARDDGIKAIVVRLESPGGVVAASQEIYDQLRKVRAEGKPVVASMGGIAASGAYYVACGADSIVANPGTLTGSIGVIMTFPNTQELFRKIGIDIQVVKTGEFKDIGSMSRPLTPEERQLLGDLIGDVYDQFVTVVATERRLDVEAVKRIADGRVLTGRQALKLGLVDRLGGFRDAVQLAGELAGIRGEPVVVKKRKRVTTLWDVIDNLTGMASKLTREGVSIEYSFR